MKSYGLGPSVVLEFAQRLQEKYPDTYIQNAQYKTSVSIHPEMPSTVVAPKSTAHCFRRSSATLVADADVNLTWLKYLGGWRQVC